MQFILRIMDFYTPHIFTAGIAYTLPVFPLTISVDVEYQLWSGYSFKQALAVYSEEPAFENIFVPKVGLHYRIIPEIGVSGGYCYRSSFVPDSALEGDLNLLDATTHILSAGLEFIIPKMGGMGGPIHFNLAYQLQIVPQRNITKNTALINAGLEPFNPSYSVKGMMHSFSAEVVFRW